MPCAQITNGVQYLQYSKHENGLIVGKKIMKKSNIHKSKGKLLCFRDMAKDKNARVASE